MVKGRAANNTMAGSGLADLKSRLLFVLIAVLVFRIGTYIPVPGLNSPTLTRAFQLAAEQYCGSV